MDHKVPVFEGLKNKNPQTNKKPGTQYIHKKISLHFHLQHGHLAQITSPKCYLKIPLKA